MRICNAEYAEEPSILMMLLAVHVAGQHFIPIVGLTMRAAEYLGADAKRIRHLCQVKQKMLEKSTN